MDNEIKQIKTILDGMKEDEEFIITNMIVKYADVMKLILIHYRILMSIFKKDIYMNLIRRI